MNKQLKHVVNWLSRKVVLLFVLFFAIILLGTSLYHFLKQNVVLERQFKTHLALVEEKVAYEHLNFTLITAESSIKAYIISGDKRFLGNYITSIDSVANIYSQFKSFNNSSNLSEFIKYNNWLLSKVTLLTQIKLLCDANKNSEVKLLISSSEAMRMGDTTVQLYGHILEQNITKSKQDLIAANSFYNTLAYISIGTAIALLSGVFYLLITEVISRKKLNEALKQQKEYFTITINSIGEGLIATDKSGVILYMNAAAEKLTQWTNKEANGLALETVYNIVNESTGLHFENVVSRILKNGRTIDFENNTVLHTKQNKQLIISNSGSPIFDSNGKISGAVLVFNDITERKKIEKALIDSELFNRGVIDSVSSHIAIVNTAGTIINVNKPWEKFALENGVDPAVANSIGSNYFSICQKQSDNGDAIALQTLEGIQNVLNGSIESFYLEYPCHSANQMRWFYMRVMKFESSETLAVIEHHDITERKLAEEITLKAIERYEILAKATSDTIWDWDIINDKMLYNEGVTKMFGYQKSEVDNVVNWWQEKIHPDDLEVVVSALNELNANKTVNLQLEYRFRCTDGDYKYIYDRAFVLYNAEGKPTRIIGAMQDISYEKAEEMRITNAMIAAQELERRYIGAELHDNVNQILVGALLSLGIAKDKSDGNDSFNQYYQITKGHISNAILELRKLSHQLVPSSFEERNLKEMCEDLFASVNLNNALNINFDCNISENNLIKHDVQINLYRILQESFKNILKYAEATIVDVSLELIHNLLTMRVSDNGKGFNFKDIRKGIGLSNIKKRAEAFSGKCMINTNIGKGCEIIVEIPIV
ncbi:PAS domain S-box protein [Parasediminibacterium paludis]|uniref:histidine kinase n=1 Tax=Parasediminibacterium paludis TaxID=908966 RepID=A0ABV8PQX3_9BACT